MNQLTTRNILSLFDTDRKDRENFADDLIQRIEDGELNPLQAHAYIKRMEDLVEIINKDARYKSLLLNEGEKHGKKFQLYNTDFAISEVGTKYDYSMCGDVEWEQMDKAIRILQTAIKMREAYLKNVPSNGEEKVDKETGEAYTIYPPTKTSTTAIKTTLK